MKFLNVAAWMVRVFVVFFIAGAIVFYYTRPILSERAERKCAVGSYVQQFEDESGTFVVYHCVVIVKSAGEQRYITNNDGGTVQM